jgi:amidase
VVRADRPLSTALELAGLVRAGAASPVELVEAAIRRTEAENPRLNFLVTECFEQALEVARGPLPPGPFRGVPMLVKDLTETAGVRTTFSSRAFERHVPEADAAVVRRMKEAGFVVIGKSNTPEFGITCVTESELNGACRNPWNPGARRAGRPGGPPPRSRRACCRSRTARTAAARSGSRRRAAACSG